MSPTLSGLVAASLLLGQTSQTQVVGPVETIGSPYTGGTLQQQLIVSPPNPQPQSRGMSSNDRPILSRIKGWFGRGSTNGPTIDETKPGAVPYISPPATSAPTFTPATPGASDYYRKMPSPTSQAMPVPAQRVAAEQSIVTPAPVSSAIFEKSGATLISPIHSSLTNKVGRDERFAWITGQLEIEGGTYVIYYATPDTVDQYHGRLVLQIAQTDMNQFHRGDLVTVEGQVQNRVSPRGGAVVYRVTNIGLVERQPR